MNLQLLRTRFGYSIGHVLNDLCAAMWFSYLVVYYQNVLQFKPSEAGYLLLIGQIVDGIATPLVGYESDLTKGCGSYGRRKSWHLLGTILVLVTFPFVFNPCFFDNSASHWAKMIYYGPIISIFQIGWAATQISHLALLPEISHDDHERVLLNSLRYFFTVFSNVFVFITCYITFTLAKGPGHLFGFSEAINDSTNLFDSKMNNITNDDTVLGPKDVSAFRVLSFIMVGVGIIFSLFFHVLVKEENDKLKNEMANPIPPASQVCTETGNSIPVCTANISRPLVIPNASSRLIECTESRGYGSVTHINHPQLSRSVSDCSQTQVCSSLEDDNGDERDLLIQRPCTLPVDASLNTMGGSISTIRVYCRRMTWKDWLKEPQLYLINVLYMCTRIIVNITQVYFIFFITNSVQVSKEIAALMSLIVYISGMVTSILQRQFQAIVGRKIGYFFGLLVIVGFCLITYFMTIPKPPLYMVYLDVILLGIGNSCILIGSLAMCADLIGKNTESGAFVYGVMSLSDKFSNGLLVAVIQRFFTPSADSKIPVDFYQHVEVYVPAVCVIINIVVMLILMPMRLGQRWSDRNHALIANESNNGAIN